MRWLELGGERLRRTRGRAGHGGARRDRRERARRRRELAAPKEPSRSVMELADGEGARGGGGGADFGTKSCASSRHQPLMKAEDDHSNGVVLL